MICRVLAAHAAGFTIRGLRNVANMAPCWGNGRRDGATLSNLPYVGERERAIVCVCVCVCVCERWRGGERERARGGMAPVMGRRAQGWGNGWLNCSVFAKERERE